MTRELALWVGSWPASDADALAIHEKLAQRFPSGETPGASRGPSPEVEGFLADVRARLPPATAAWEQRSDATGTLTSVSLDEAQAATIVAMMAGRARVHGVVVFDPSSRTLVRLIAAHPPASSGEATGRTPGPRRGVVTFRMGPRPLKLPD